MKFKIKVTSKYLIFSGNIKDIMLRAEEYLAENEDDRDYLIDMSHSKEHFLTNPTVKNIAKSIDNHLEPKWLYDIIRKNL